MIKKVTILEIKLIDSDYLVLIPVKVQSMYY